MLVAQLRVAVRPGAGVERGGKAALDGAGGVRRQGRWASRRLVLVLGGVGGARLDGAGRCAQRVYTEVRGPAGVVHNPMPTQGVRAGWAGLAGWLRLVVVHGYLLAYALRKHC